MGRVLKGAADPKGTWSLETQGDSEALLEHRAGLMRVTIPRLGAGAERWYVKLLQQRYEIEAGIRYCVSFRARGGAAAGGVRHGQQP